MNRKHLRCTAQLGLLVLAASIGALAQDWTPNGLPLRLSGQINAYSPQTSTTGPYEVRGPWSLQLKDYGTRADFSAAVNMQLSDGWVLTFNKNSQTPFDPTARNAHTHNIIMTNAEVTWLSTGGFKVVGTATVTLNGGATPFAQQSTLTIVVKGGTTGIEPIRFSNITLVFGLPASGHFGPQALPGVVVHVQYQE